MLPKPALIFGRTEPRLELCGERNYSNPGGARAERFAEFVAAVLDTVRPVGADS
jgi:hypothetical protein